MTKQALLFELGCEELPSQMVLPLAQALATGIEAKLQSAQIGFGEVIYYGTPRRIAVWIKAVDETQAVQHIQRKGPAKKAAFDAQGQPTPALLGFARSCEVSLDEVVFQATDKGDWAVVEKTVPGEKTLRLLPEFFKEVLAAMPIPKPMYWGEQTGPFVRPVHWILGLFGEDVIQGSYFGIQADRFTIGHRYHFPQQHVVNEPSAYESLLRRLNVEPSFEARRAKVIELVNAQAEACHGKAVINEALIDEVTSIVEWPVAVTGCFSETFLRLPEEVLIASMQAHQKCFAVRDAQGKLQPHFITVLNIESQNLPQVMAGNEKVMRARLSDADFFYTQDSKAPLIAFRPMLEHALFQASLGSLGDQLRRMETMLPLFCQHLQVDECFAKRAIELSKCDLMTAMVGEFPELQGVMGYYYAKQSNEEETVSLAMKEQYLPRFAQDDLPTAPLGWLLSLLNRLDTLVGIFGIGQKPTGMKDPYKLRRHALAVIRLLAQLDVPLELTACLQAVVHSYSTDAAEPRPSGSGKVKAPLPDGRGSVKFGGPDTVPELKTFILERLPAYFSVQGIDASLVTCVTAVQSECIYDLSQRVLALNRTRDRLQPLLGGVKRVHHLLKSVKDEQMDENIDPALFEGQPESALFAAMNQIQTQLNNLELKRDYEQCLLKLSELRPVIDAFFDAVMVMVEDQKLRLNRLKLLNRLKKTLFSVADLSQL